MYVITIDGAKLTRTNTALIVAGVTLIFFSIFFSILVLIYGVVMCRIKKNGE